MIVNGFLLKTTPTNHHNIKCGKYKEYNDLLTM